MTQLEATISQSKITFGQSSFTNYKQLYIKNYNLEEWCLLPNVHGTKMFNNKNKNILMKKEYFLF